MSVGKRNPSYTRKQGLIMMINHLRHNEEVQISHGCSHSACSFCRSICWSFVRSSTRLIEPSRLISNICNGSFAILYEPVIQSVHSSDTSIAWLLFEQCIMSRLTCACLCSMDGLSSTRQGLSYATTWGAGSQDPARSMFGSSWN